ncbi:MAG: glycosyltransferase, partial [Bacteroidota bacterium]
PKLKYCYTVAPQLAQVLSKQYQTHFEVIRNVPFSRRPIWTPKKETKIILYQGVLNDGRGLQEAILAMKSLPNSLQLHLAGEGDLSTELRALVKKEHLEKRVKFLGFLKPDELRIITPQAFLGLNLLENKGLNYYYSLANKCFDYIQAGLPSIHPAFPEYLNLQEQYKCFYLLEQVKPQNVSNLILTILENPNDYEQKCRNATKAAQHLTWEEESKKLIQFYANIF